MRGAANPWHSPRRASRYIYVQQSTKGKAADESKVCILSAIGSCTLVLYYWPHCDEERITNSETKAMHRGISTLCYYRYHLEYVLLSRLQTVSLTVLRYTAIRVRLRRFVTSKTDPIDICGGRISLKTFLASTSAIFNMQGGKCTTKATAVGRSSFAHALVGLGTHKY
jgi:hypothetical protein